MCLCNLQELEASSTWLFDDFIEAFNTALNKKATPSCLHPADAPTVKFLADLCVHVCSIPVSSHQTMNCMTMTDNHFLISLMFNHIDRWLMHQNYGCRFCLFLASCHKTRGCWSNIAVHLKWLAVWIWLVWQGTLSSSVLGGRCSLMLLAVQHLEEGRWINSFESVCGVLQDIMLLIASIQCN